MAKIVSFILGDSITNALVDQGKGVPALVAPQIALRPQFIPGNFSFAFSVGISDIDLQKENTLGLKLIAPDGSMVQDFGESTLPAVPIRDEMPREYQGFMINADARNVVIEHEGLYAFEVFCNGEHIGTQSVPVYKRTK